jgi:signal transduction histidine kinase
MTISELIVHEAKNILAMIHSRCELMEMGYMSSMTEDEFMAVSYRLLDRLDRLSHFAALLSEDSHFYALDCREVIEDVIADASDSFTTLQLEFNDFTENPPLILSNRLFLYHTLLNLVINAIQSMDDNGKLVITVSNTDMVVIDVKDSGEGMDEHVLANLFEKKFTTKQTGAGIGLSLVKKLVYMQQGTIEVESFLSQGTSFRLSFPHYHLGMTHPKNSDFISDDKKDAVLDLFKVNSDHIRQCLNDRKFDELDTIVLAFSRQLYHLLMR